MIHALRLSGVLIGVLALLHLAFPRRFAWRTELARLSTINRQIFLVHCFFLVLILCMQAALLVTMPGALLDPSPLARALTGALCLFWGLRLLAQWFIYEWDLWRGRPFETCVHVGFTTLWAYLTTVFALALR